MATLRDAIYGLAVGDALGVPFEFKGRGSFTVTTMIGHGVHNQLAGTWSDDTSLALAACHSIKLIGKINPKDIMERFRAWLYDGEYTPHGEVFDCGSTTSSSIRRGYGIDNERTNGNGSLMRIVPLAFVPTVTNDEITAVSALTHAHDLSKQACILYVRLAQELLSGHKLMTAIRKLVKPDSPFKRLLLIDTLTESDIRSSGYVLDTLEAAIWSVVTTNSFKDCVLRAVNLGDDTDTTGAVAGALAGIIYGHQSIPAEWIDTLQNKELIDSCLF